MVVLIKEGYKYISGAMMKNKRSMIREEISELNNKCQLAHINSKRMTMASCVLTRTQRNRTITGVIINN